MRNRKNRHHRDQTRNPATVMGGDYVFHVETIAVRLIGKKGAEQERAYITGPSREKWSFDASSFRFTSATLDATTATPSTSSSWMRSLTRRTRRIRRTPTEGPNPYAFDEDGTGLGLPIGAYRVAKKNSCIFLRIAKKEGNKFQKDIGQTDREGYVNSIVRVVDAVDSQ